MYELIEQGNYKGYEYEIYRAQDSRKRCFWVVVRDDAYIRSECIYTGAHTAYKSLCAAVDNIR